VADGRLLRLVDAFQAEGLSVEVVGRGDPLDGPPGASMRTILPERESRHRLGGLAARAGAALTQPVRARGVVLVTLTPDPLLTASARRLLGGPRLVADCQEDYLAVLSDRSWATGTAGSAGRAFARMGRWAAARADLTVVADEHVPPSTARHRMVVRNLPSGRYLPEPSDPDDVPRAIYVGDVRTSRGLRTMLSAIEAATHWELDIVGPVSRQDQAWLDAWRASSIAAPRVRVHGRLPPARAWSLASGAWVGLALLDLTPAFVAAVPSKVYEYLFCGLPAIVTPLPRAAALVEEAGAGSVVRDAAEAAQALESLSDAPDRLHGKRRAAREWAAAQSSRPSGYSELAREVHRLVLEAQS
jgi:glycosyltransferase involved in cell wall biosynthesis